MSEKTQSTRVITPECIISYPQLATPKQGTDDKGQPKGDPKYSCALAFPVGSDLTEMKLAALAAAETKWPGKVTAMREANAKSIAGGGNPTFRFPFRTDIKENSGLPEGATFFNARTGTKPQCVYAHAAPGSNKPERIPDEKIAEVVYPGAIVKASVTFYAYDREGNKGVAVALNNVQKIREGTRLDSNKAADDEFTPDLSAKPADLASLGLSDI